MNDDATDAVLARARRWGLEPHWHAENPWASRLVYVPLAALAMALADPLRSVVAADGVTISRYSADWILAHWRQGGRDKLDAYILPNGEGRAPSIGVRHGPNDSDYYSGGGESPAVRETLQALLERYGVDPPNADAGADVPSPRFVYVLFLWGTPYAIYDSREEAYAAGVEVWEPTAEDGVNEIADFTVERWTMGGTLARHRRRYAYTLTRPLK